MKPLSSQGKRVRGRKGQAMRLRRLQRSQGLCEDCLQNGRTRAATKVDHIKPLGLGGMDIDENTRNLCDPCHEARTVEQFNLKRKPRYGVDDGWPIEEENKDGGQVQGRWRRHQA